MQTLFESFPIIPILFICYKENCNLFFIYLYLSIKNRKNKLQISLYQMKRIGMIGKDLKRVWEAKNSKNYFFVKNRFSNHVYLLQFWNIDAQFKQIKGWFSKIHRVITSRDDLTPCLEKKTLLVASRRFICSWVQRCTGLAGGSDTYHFTPTLLALLLLKQRFYLKNLWSSSALLVVLWQLWTSSQEQNCMYSSHHKRCEE